MPLMLAAASASPEMAVIEIGTSCSFSERRCAVTMMSSVLDDSFVAAATSCCRASEAEAMTDAAAALQKSARKGDRALDIFSPKHMFIVYCDVSNETILVWKSHEIDIYVVFNYFMIKYRVWDDYFLINHFIEIGRANV